jgi:signal transduction histidine kinase
LRVYGDPERLAECFDELVVNATHWLDKPEKRLRVVVSLPERTTLPTSVDSTRDYALIHFLDNGIGVPLKNKTKIFDAFFTTHDHGTGLGLALVRRIVEGHGGAILESGTPGQGADFEVYLPLTPEAKQATVPAAHSRKQRRKE